MSLKRLGVARIYNRHTDGVRIKLMLKQRGKVERLDVSQPNALRRRAAVFAHFEIVPF